MIYEDKIPANERTAFLRKLVEISGKLGVKPEWLMIVFNSESGVNPSAVNPSGGATGLIQFMPYTAIGLGTTTEQLKKMSATKQLDYVYLYYRPYANKITSFSDLYLFTFYPAALNKKPEWVFGSEISNEYARKVASQNKAMDLNNSGYIAKWEFEKWVNAKLPANIDGSVDLPTATIKFLSRNMLLIVAGTFLIVGGILIAKGK